jgi:hypothetical protein
MSPCAVICGQKQRNERKANTFAINQRPKRPN